MPTASNLESEIQEIDELIQFINPKLSLTSTDLTAWATGSDEYQTENVDSIADKYETSSSDGDVSIINTVRCAQTISSDVAISTLTTRIQWATENDASAEEINYLNQLLQKSKLKRFR